MRFGSHRSGVHAFSAAGDARSQERVLSSLGAGRIEVAGRPGAHAALGWWSAIREKLGPNEYRRRFWHIVPGFLPFLLWPIPHKDPLTHLLKGIMIAIAITLSAGAWIQHHSFRRRGEHSPASAVLGYAGIVLGMLILFPAAPELGLTVMSVIAFGDGSATLAGLLIGGPKLPWNSAKSWAGLTAFVLVAMPLAMVVYWGEAQPRVPLALALAVVTPACLVAAVVESVPARLNDNIRVGLAAAVTIVLTHAMFVGR